MFSYFFVTIRPIFFLLGETKTTWCKGGKRPSYHHRKLVRVSWGRSGWSISWGRGRPISKQQQPLSRRSKRSNSNLTPDANISHLQKLVAACFPDNSSEASSWRESTEGPEEQERNETRSSTFLHPCSEVSSNHSSNMPPFPFTYGTTHSPDTGTQAPGERTVLMVLWLLLSAIRVHCCE